MLLTPLKTAVDNIYTESEKTFPDPSIEVIPITVGKLLKIPNPTGTRLWEPQDISGWTIRAAIGQSFLPPIAGDFTLAQGAQGPVLLDYDSTAQEIQAALAMASITGSVEEIGTGYFKFTFTSPGTQAQITADATNLAPLSIVEIGTLVEGDTDTREVQTIRLMQSPAAYAVLTEDSTPTVAGVTVLATGGTGVNHKVRITLDPLPYDGRFSITIGGHETAMVAFDVSDEDLTTALEALTSVGAGNVSVFRETIGQYLVSFQGTKAATAMGTITADDSALLSITTKSGELDLRTAAIQLMLNGAETEDAFLEIEGTPPAGTPQKLYRQPVTIVGSIITPGSLAPPQGEEYYNETETDALLATKQDKPTWFEANSPHQIGHEHNGQTVILDNTASQSIILKATATKTIVDFIATTAIVDGVTDVLLTAASGVAVKDYTTGVTQDYYDIDAPRVITRAISEPPSTWYVVTNATGVTV